MLKMINEAKDGLGDTLRTNDISREEELVQAAEDVISISSDDNYDQNQAIYHPNQRHHLLKHPHYQLNTLMIMKKHP